MAKDEPAADYEFKLPNFDEDAFIHKEMVSFKTTSILFGLGIIAAAVSWFAFGYVHGDPKRGWLVGLAIVVAFGVAVKPIFNAFKVDHSVITRGGWWNPFTGVYALLFYTWLAFFIVVINPPLSDYAPPQVIIGADPPTQLVNGTVSLSLLVLDNDRVADQVLEVSRDGQPVAASLSGSSRDLQFYNLTNLPAGKYTVTATGHDAHGLATTGHANFTVASQDFRIDLPPGGVLGTTSKLVVHLPGFPSCREHYAAGCVRNVYLHLTSGTDIALDAPNSDRPGDWSGDATFKGWSHGLNTFSVHAEFLNHFEGVHSVSGGSITLPGPYTVNMTAEPGSHVADVPPAVANRQLNVPHLELVALVGVVVGAAAIARRRND